MSAIVSPSSRRLNLIVPCEAGCDGPIWISITSPVGSCSTKRPGVSEPGAVAIVSALPPRVPRTRNGIALGHQRLALVHRIVLAERVPLELRVHEDTAQVRMAREAYAEHVPHLALGPVGRLPEAGGARDDGGVLGYGDLHAQPVVQAQRVQLIDDLEARRATEVVDGGQIGELREPGVGMI